MRLLAAATLLLALGCRTARIAPAPAPGGPTPLDAMIRLTEMRENGTSVDTTFGTTPRLVDINSNIVIDVTAPPLSGATASKSELVRLGEQFRASAATLPEVVRRAHSVAERRRSGALADQALGTERRAINQALFSFAQSIRLYSGALAGSSDPAIQARGTALTANVNAAIDDPDLDAEQTALKIGDLLIAEADWLSAKLMDEATAAATPRPTRALVLAASNGDNPPTFLPLPNYNNIEPGVPVTFDKLRPLSSPADVAALQASFAEAKAVAQLGNELRSGGKDFRTAVSEILAASGFDVQGLVTNFQAVVADVGSVKPADLTTALQAFTTALPANPPADDAALVSSLRGLAGTVTANIANFSAARDRLEQQVAKVSPRLLRADLQSTTDPVTAITMILSSVTAARQLVGEGQADLVNLTTQVRSTLASAQSVVMSFTTLGTETGKVQDAALKQDLTTALNSVPSLSKLVTDLTALQTSVDTTLAAINRIRTQLRDPNPTAFAADPPDSSLIVGFDALKDTYLDLRSIPDRRPGDAVALHAWIYDVTPAANDTFVLGQRVDERVQQFEMTRFGFFVDPSAGVAFVRSEFKPAGQTERTHQFAPQISLLGHYNPWPSAEEAANRRPPWYSGLGAGIHAISFDLNEDNQLELGLGVAVSLGPWLRFGYGFDLTLDEGRYTYFDVPILRLLSQVGLTVPGTAAK